MKLAMAGESQVETGSRFSGSQRRVNNLGHVEVVFWGEDINLELEEREGGLVLVRWYQHRLPGHRLHSLCERFLFLLHRDENLPRPAGVQIGMRVVAVNGLNLSG